MSKTVFTNGCFDLLHPGHVDLLERARKLGDRLVVGLNSDESIRAIKGSGRPIQGQEARKAVLESIRSVDEVIIFDESTPERIIKEIKPQVLVKGGDWDVREIVGADVVSSYGGEVHVLPLLKGFSTSSLVEAIKSERRKSTLASDTTVNGTFQEHFNAIDELRTYCLDSILKCADVIIDTFKNGKKILICGNGGSAADAQHLAAEFVGRYERDRVSLPAFALTTDTSALTAIANDFDFSNVFSRQVEGTAHQGDCLIALSTSGNSPNILSAVMAARARNCRVIGLTGAGGKKLASICDVSVMVPSDRTARIQEAHILIAHIWCQMVDIAFTEDGR